MKELLLIAMIAVSAWGGTNSLSAYTASIDECGWGRLVVGDDIAYDTLTITNGLKIKTDTGEVTIPTNMTVSVASKAFWSGVMECYGTKERVVKTLAESGEFCKVYGHWWGRCLVMVEGEGQIDVEASQNEHCKICGAMRVTKTVTEIIPKENK